jgi:Fe-S oxidoreductase
MESMGFDRRRPLPVFKRAWTSKRGARHEARDPRRRVVLFADTFNNWLEPENLDAAKKVLEATGHEVVVAAAKHGQPLCCGRTYLAAGMMAEARAEALRTLHALKPYLDEATPVVGLEPSCIFSFRDEYAAMFPGDEIAMKIAGAQLVDEYLATEVRAGRIAVPWKAGAASAIRVHGHCHQKAFGTFEATLELLRTIPNADVAAIESSCCGMAGAFGHEKEHYDVSMKMGELSLLPAVRSAPVATAIAAAGTSCRQQIHDGTGRVARHPIALLADLV